METQYMGTATPSPWPGSDLDKWGDVLASACDAIAGASPDLMKSITVTGSLDGTEGEARLLMVLCKQRATECGLQVTFKLNGRAFTAQFSRRDGASNGRSWR